MQLKFGRVDLVKEFFRFARLVVAALVAILLGYLILVVGFGRLFVAGGPSPSGTFRTATTTARRTLFYAATHFGTLFYGSANAVTDKV